jgi:hypothetical protein
MEQVIRDILASGKAGTCPCCDQTVKLYPRRIYANMLRFLRQLSQAPQGLTPKQAYLSPAYSGDYAKLSYWGLIEQDKEQVWHITDVGEGFLAGRVMIASHAIVYNGEVQGFSKNLVSIDDCREMFDLDELLNPRTIAEVMS